ncbi:hypothetical protein HKX48_000599 [Thoreauomyces humboldtii]|nr:hypothetical protein HKX48_000599 [Thoreauomyces humboldtii]
MATTTHRSVHTHPSAPPPQCWSHRHFPTYHPTASRLLSKKWEERARDIHLAKLHSAHPSVDNAPPKRWAHLEVRLKRLQVEQERLYEIERANHILLDRISFQMQTPSTLHAPPGTPGNPTGRNPNHVSASQQPKRQQEQREIAQANQTIMQRIEEKAPNYRRAEWGRARCRNLEYLRNIAAFSESYERVLENHIGGGGAAGGGGPGTRSRPRTGQTLQQQRASEGEPRRGRSAMTATRAVVVDDGAIVRRPARAATASWIPVLRNTGRPQTRVNTMMGPLSDAGTTTDEETREELAATANSANAAKSDEGSAAVEASEQPQRDDFAATASKLPPLPPSRPMSAQQH